MLELDNVSNIQLRRLRLPIKVEVLCVYPKYLISEIPTEYKEVTNARE